MLELLHQRPDVTRPRTRGGKKRLDAKLIYAAETRNLKELSKCLEMGANPNTYNEYLVASLHIAAERGDVILGHRLLLCKGININIATEHSYTPLILACLFNKKKMANMLLRRGADPNIADRRGFTPLHVCARSGCFTIARYLIQFKANVNAKDCFGNTPVAISCLDNPNLMLAKFLLFHGVDLSMERNDNKLHLFFEVVLSCRTSTFIGFVKLLLDKGVDVNMIDEITGRNCLHFVALSGFFELGFFLLTEEANCELVDRSSRTPAMLARDHHNKTIADLFENLNVRNRTKQKVVWSATVMDSKTGISSTVTK